jgi:hypothetical protein
MRQKKNQKKFVMMSNLFNKINKNDIIAILIGVVIFIIIGITSFIKSNNLKRDGIYTRGNIIGKSKGSKGTAYLDFTFKFNSKDYYNTSESIEFCCECKNQCCEIGDSVIVHFSKSKIDNCELVHELPTGADLSY